MYQNVFLDDIRQPVDCVSYRKEYEYVTLSWSVVRSYNEFIDAIQRCYIVKGKLPEVISFDHDLHQEHYHTAMYSGLDAYNAVAANFKEKTGYDCAVWFYEFCEKNKLDMPNIMCHSQNPVGNKKIMSLLNSYEKPR